jgi:hypothetical protein
MLALTDAGRRLLAVVATSILADRLLLVVFIEVTAACEGCTPTC